MKHKEEEGAATTLLQLSSIPFTATENTKKRSSTEMEKITSIIGGMSMETEAPDFNVEVNGIKKRKLEIEDKSTKIQNLQQKRSVAINPKSRHNITISEILSKLRFLSGAIIRRDSENLSVNDALDRFRRTLVRFFTSYSFQQGIDGQVYKFKVKYQRNIINMSDNAHKIRIRVMAKKSEYELLTGTLKEAINSAIQTVGESIIKNLCKRR